MNIAFTVWYNDLIILDVWLKYYSRYFDKLFVLCCATKDKYIPELGERMKKYNLSIEHNGSLEDPNIANQTIRSKQIELLKDHKWVLYTNCDEIIAPSPKYKDLKDFMSRRKKDWVACEAFDVIEWNEPPIDFTKPLLTQRKYWIKNTNMNKVILSKVPLDWNEGQHQISEVGSEQSIKFHDTGLYLVHLRHFNVVEEEAHPRDFGPFKHGVHANVYEQREKEEFRLEMPEWVRNLL